MTAPENALKAALAAGRVLKGPFLSLGSEAVTEIAGLAGFGYVLIDAEHGPFDPKGILTQIRTLEATGTPAAVRVPGHDDWVLKQVLDAGAQTIMVPVVDTVMQAQRIAAACRFPPEGRRGNGGSNTRSSGYGARAGYATTANAELLIIVQIESVEGMKNIEAIAAVDGIDGLFIGPADLGGDMGHHADLNADAVWQAAEDGVRRIAATGKVAGVFAVPDRVAQMIAAGATLLGTGSDAGLLTAAMRTHAEGLK